MEQEHRQPLDFQPTPEFLARAKRMDDAMHLRKPDRVPVAPLCIHFYATRIRGISNKEAMYDQEWMFQALKEETLLYDWDAAPPVGPVMAAKPLELLGIQQFKWPGGGVSDDQPFQWVENEYVRQDEYDEMLANPNGFSLKKLWPRISATLAPLGEMAKTPPPPLLSVSNAYTLPVFLAQMIGQSPLRGILKAAGISPRTASGENHRSFRPHRSEKSKKIYWRHDVLLGQHPGLTHDFWDTAGG